MGSIGTPAARPTDSWRSYEHLFELLPSGVRVSLGDADALVPREAQDGRIGAIPNADLVVYAGVGHTPRWEDPGRFRSDLVTFARAVWP